MPSPTFWLSFHTPYACRQSGICCSAGWDIAIERSRVPAIAGAIERGRIQAPVRWYRPAVGAPDEVAGVVEQGSDRRCLFHRSPGCAIHLALGHAAMPFACQHFPRIALIDRRGVFVTLSHYCPTAAALLFDATAPATIVPGPPALPTGETPEGLDAREALPPLDTPRRLLDWDDYSRWEARAVELLTREPVDVALASLDPDAPPVPDRELFALATASVPAEYAVPAFTDAPAGQWRDDEAVVGRYLAAHAFAAWTAYQGNGLRCTVLYLRLVHAVVKSERARIGTLFDAIRQADLLLRHLVDRQTVADRLSEIAAR